MISRDFALCLLFGLEFNSENVIKAKEKLANYGDLEVCYQTSERNPILVPINRIPYDPFTYKRYVEASPIITKVEKKIQLCSDSQIAEFINAVIGIDKEAYHDYEKKLICPENVFNIVKLFTNKFENEYNFTQWCRGKVNYTQVPFTRKRNVAGSVPRMRELYVLKSELHENVAKNIITKLSSFKTHMENLKKDFILLGYVRKSVKAAQYRIKNIQNMVDNLYSRSNVDKCYVSYSSDANSDITTRDFRDDVKTLKKIQNIHGNTQNMIDFISATKQKVCIVIIDYAGLSTDPVNIQQFVKDNDAIEKIIVDCFPYTCNAVELERSQMLDDITTLSPFDCRETPRQRSKK